MTFKVTYTASKKGMLYPENIIETTLKNLNANATENKMNPPQSSTDGKFLLFSSSVRTICQYLKMQKMHPNSIKA